MASGYVPYKYETMLPLERDFDADFWLQWFRNYWWSSLAIAVVYIAVVLGGQRIMANRKAFDLRYVLFLWNVGLSAYSLFAWFRILPEFMHVFLDNGVVASGAADRTMCDMSFIQSNRVTQFWQWTFVLSKLFELGDTLFIVLRKKKLIFLHWYHHATVLIYEFGMLGTGNVHFFRWFAILNLFIHGVMYGYYAIQVFARLPKWTSVSVTLLQMTQMAISLGLHYRLLTYYRPEASTQQSQCVRSMPQWVTAASMALVISYLLLFANFFVRSYLGAAKGQKEKQQKESKQSSKKKKVAKVDGPKTGTKNDANTIKTDSRNGATKIEAKNPTKSPTKADARNGSTKIEAKNGTKNGTKADARNGSSKIEAKNGTRRNDTKKTK